MANIKKDFPFFQYHPRIIFFDNAATTQKPVTVINTIGTFYEQYNAPIKRGIYAIAEHATLMYENARKNIAEFIGAAPDEIIFTENATDSINFIASMWGLQHIHKGDEIVITALEHHANILPWQRLCQQKGAFLKIIPIAANGMLDIRDLDSIISSKTKIVSFLNISNAIGTHVPVEALIQAAQNVGARILIDACQSVLIQKLHIKQLKIDFLVFSSHKIFGPTGIGVLYINQEIQDQIEPYRLGGGMLFSISDYKPEWQMSPARFEAGTPPVAQAIGLSEAVDYIKNLRENLNLQDHVVALCKQFIQGLEQLPNIKILGPTDQLKQEGHIVSFLHEKYHFHDVGAYLDAHDICVRTGNFCAQPLADALGIDGAIRVSFCPYNEPTEVEYVLDVLKSMKI